MLTNIVLLLCWQLYKTKLDTKIIEFLLPFSSCTKLHISNQTNASKPYNNDSFITASLKRVHRYKAFNVLSFALLKMRICCTIYKSNKEIAARTRTAKNIESLSILMSFRSYAL